MFGRDAQTHAQLQIGRITGGAHDLFQLVDRVEREGAHAMDMVRFRDRFLGLDRVHETELGLAFERFGNETHFGDRGHVEVRDTRIEKRADQVGRRIRLDRIERSARKLLNEETGGPSRGFGTNQRYRCCRCEGGRYPQRAMMLVQLKGPPV